MTGGAEAVTVIVEVAAAVPLRTDAVIVAVPIAIAWTEPPLGEIVATCGFDEVHTSVSSTASPAESLAIASSWSDPPTASHAFAGIISRTSTELRGGWTGSSSLHENASKAQARTAAHFRVKAAENTQDAD